MTRQRVRSEKHIETSEENPNKDGEIIAPIVIVERMEESIRTIIQKEKGKLYFTYILFWKPILRKGWQVSKTSGF